MTQPKSEVEIRAIWKKFAKEAAAENKNKLRYENGDFHNMQIDVDDVIEHGDDQPTALELRHICRSGFGDMGDEAKTIKKLANQLREGKYRALILNAPGSKKMKEPRMATTCPDWSTFVEICCAILAALDIPTKHKLRVIQIDLQAMWDGMIDTVMYYKGKRNLIRNIFFVATGTGDMCVICYQFDLEITERHHKAICYKSTAEVRNTPEGNNMKTRRDGRLECNSCLTASQDEKVTVQQFQAAHHFHDHKKVEQMLSGHLTYATERPGETPTIKKPKKFDGWSRLEETIVRKAPYASKIDQPDELPKFYVVCAAVSFT